MTSSLLSTASGALCVLLAGCTLLSGTSQSPPLQPVVQYETSEVTCLAGSVPGYFDGPGADAKFMSMRALAIDASGSAYVSDLGQVADKAFHWIRRIDSAGTVSTFAGGEAGLVEGPLSEARFNVPNGLAFGPDNRLYVSDANNNRVRLISPDGIVSTFAGGTQGYANGAPTDARFFLPRDIAADKEGNVYLAEEGNIRRITPAGQVSTLAGGPGALAGGSPDGQPRVSPRGIAVDPQGNVLVADDGRAAVLKISPAGEVTTVAGAATFGREHVDGSAAQAHFVGPEDVAADASGNVFVADADGTVRRVSPDAQVTTIAGVRGWDAPKVTEGEGSKVRFGQLTSIAVEASGSLLVTTATRLYRIRLK